MDYGALIQAAIGVVGELLAADKRDEAEALLTRMRTQFEGIQLPNIEEIEAQQLGQSAFEGIQTDPMLESAQSGALGQVSELAETGSGAQDRAALSRLANMAARRQRAGAAGIEADMAARGQAGSGLDYATRAQLASDTNQRIGEGSLGVAGQAADRRANAILAKGDLAGRMRGQQYSEKANAAKARDDIMRYNAQSRDSTNRYNQGQRQQRFQNQMQKTGAIANPTNALAGFKVQSANDTRQLASGIGDSANQFVNSWDDEDEKKKKEGQK